MARNKRGKKGVGQKKQSCRIIDLMQKRVAEIAIGASTLRNQGAPEVVATARKYLKKIRLTKFNVRSKEKFLKVLNRHTKILKEKFQNGARGNWGAARKALNIFLRDVLYHHYLCDYYKLKKLEPWLEVPLDKDVIEGLKRDMPADCEIPRRPSIKKLTHSDSNKFQCVAKRIAEVENLARLHLDLRYWRQ